MILSSEQRQTLSAVCALLVPADDLGPGAVEAGAPEYIEQALASAYSKLAPLYAYGLELLDARARARCGTEFAAAAERVQIELLTELEAVEMEVAERRFFEAVRNHTIEALFGQPHWGGNREHIGWKLIGYPQPRLYWAEADQEIVELSGNRLPAEAQAEQ